MNFNLTTIIAAISHAILYVATALLVVIAIFVSIIRWYPNLSDVVEEKIEFRLAEILNADIVIESLDISRNKLFSEIVAENVKIIDRQNKENVWQLKKAKLGISLSKSLLTRSLRVSEVSLEGMDLSILRDEAGDLRINQTFLLPRSKMSQQAMADEGNYAHVRLALLDSNLHWVDELTETNYLFEAIDITIEPTSRGHDVFVSGKLPDILGHSLQAYLELEGNVKNLSEAKINFYLKTEQFRLTEVAKRFVGEDGESVPIVIDSEVWGQYSSKSLSALRGAIEVERIVENPNQINQSLCLSDEYIQQLSMKFDWQNADRNWRFQANEVEVVSSKRDWPKSDMQFELVRHSLNAKTILAHIGSMNLGAICNTLHTYSPHIVRFENQLKDYRFNASIDDLFVKFDLSDNHQSSYQYSAQFSDATAWMSKGERMFSGLSGFVEGGDTGGKALIDAQEVVLRLPEQYPNFDLRFATQGELKWNHQGESHELYTDSLKVFNDDMSMGARIHAKVSGENVYTDSQIHLDYANANKVGNYFPLFIKTQRTKKWLTDAIHKGDVTNASVLLRGDMRSFPFQKSSGVFQTRVNVENGILEYKKDWPQLEQVQAKVAIDKQRINISSNHATTLNSKVKTVDINIDNFLLSVMQLNGTVDGPAQDLLQFLGDASLVKKTNSVVDQISLQGDSRLELDFSRSLSRKVDYPAKVSGKIHFLGNNLDINKVGIELNDVAGEVAFDAKGAASELINANLHGHPVDISLRPIGDGASTLKFDGGFDLGEYLNQSYPRFKSFFNGSTNVNGELHLPSFFKKDNPDKLRLKIESQLVGIESKLPVPLDKNKQATMNALILYDQKQGLMSWRVPELIGLHFSLKPEQPFTLNMVDLDAQQDVDIVDSDLVVKGSWQELQPDLWLAAYKQYSSTSATQSKSSAMPDVQVNINSLIFPQWPAENLRILGGEENGDYVIDLDSSLGKGIIRVPINKSKAVSIDMNTLIIKKTANSTESSSNKKISNINPAKLRPFLFQANV